MNVATESLKHFALNFQSNRIGACRNEVSGRFNCVIKGHLHIWLSETGCDLST